MARDLGADALATGHYIESRAGTARSPNRTMHVPSDIARDQSYFLFATTQEQLDYLRFPLGHMKKDEVRELAARYGLAVAAKPDSQDICFVPNGDYASIITKLRPEAHDPGNIVHIDGRTLGQHDGIINFTTGQRRGLGVATGDPLYVISIDAPAKQVIVGPREALMTRDIGLRDINWLGRTELAQTVINQDVFVKVRSTKPAVPAQFRTTSEGVTVSLQEGDHGISPGQACVLYSGEGAGAQVLGGGWIDRTCEPSSAVVKKSSETTAPLA